MTNKIQTLTSEIEEMESRLQQLRGGAVLVTPAERARVQKAYDMYRV